MVELKPHFQLPINVPIERYPTKELFTLQAVDYSVGITEEDLTQMVRVCNERQIYNTFFRAKFAGRPYSREDARFFMDIAKEGWQKSEWFIFLLRDPRSRIIGLMDIMSTDIEKPAQLGYWVSSETPGVATNALAALCDLAKEAGFTSLYGTPRPTNSRSRNLLERVGFSGDEIINVSGTFYLKLTKQL